MDDLGVAVVVAPLDPPNDSVIALCMALEAFENQPEPVELVGWL